MALAEVAGGDQVATVTTEHTLTTHTGGKTVVLVVDTNAMVAGDILELRLKTKARSGGTSRLAYYAAFAHVQAAPIKYSVPVPANIECVATLKQTAGTSRTFTWALLSLD
jgi:hypothetical protein